MEILSTPWILHDAPTRCRRTAARDSRIVCGGALMVLRKLDFGLTRQVSRHPR